MSKKYNDITVDILWCNGYDANVKRHKLWVVVALCVVVLLVVGLVVYFTWPKNNEGQKLRFGSYVTVTEECDLLYKDSMYATEYSKYPKKLLVGDVVVVLDDYVPYSADYISVRVFDDEIAKTANNLKEYSTGIIRRDSVNPIGNIKDDVWFDVPDGISSAGVDVIDNSLYLAYNLQQINPVLNTGASYIDGRLSFNCSGFMHFAMKLGGFDNGAYHDGDTHKTAFNLFNDVRFDKIFNALNDEEGIIEFRNNDIAFENYLAETLQKGDLIFFYTTDAERYTDINISHVAMYAGNGMMIHNSTPYGVLVEDVWQFSSTYGLKSLRDNNYNNIIGISRLKQEYRTVSKVNLDEVIAEIPFVIENDISLNVEISTSTPYSLRFDFSGKGYNTISVKFDGETKTATKEHNTVTFDSMPSGKNFIEIKTEQSNYTRAIIFIEYS